jgi:hypothetical protein
VPGGGGGGGSVAHSITTASMVSGSVVSEHERVSPPTSEESPPQQTSPPQQQGLGLGRAAMRGGPHQPSSSIRNEALAPMERLTLQDTGDVGGAAAATAGAQRRVGYEQVLNTRPKSCQTKTGSGGVPVKILCNYFEVVSKPDWLLHQYHVSYAPEIDSKGFRIKLMHDHDKLFPTNKAFDGSTLYTLTRLTNVSCLAKYIHCWHSVKLGLTFFGL